MADYIHIEEATVKKDYFEWLKSLVEAEEEYSFLWWKLHNTDFIWLIDRDENRAEDGKYLRYIFTVSAYDRIDFNQEEVDEYLSGPCSVMELLVGLARRMEHDIMENDDLGDRTPEWFHDMIKNLGLDIYDDKHYSISRRLGKIEDMAKGWDHHLQFDSRYEVMVYVFCNIEHDLGIIYQPQIIFKYEYDGKKYDYHPDFMLNGKLYEVKGGQFFKVDENTGKEVMRIPWRRNKTEEEYRWHCEKEEAKHQCMLANNVIILRERDIKNLSLQTFGVGV